MEKEKVYVSLARSKQGYRIEFHIDEHLIAFSPWFPEPNHPDLELSLDKLRWLNQVDREFEYIFEYSIDH